MGTPFENHMLNLKVETIRPDIYVGVLSLPHIVTSAISLYSQKTTQKQNIKQSETNGGFQA